MPDVIDKALMAHAVIKRRLCVAINDPGIMSLEEVRSDRTCAFGLWIYGPEAIKEAGKPEFVTLRTVHAKFHEAAYEALLNTKSGNSEAAQRSIASGDFEMCSRNMVTALMALKATRPKS